MLQDKGTASSYAAIEPAVTMFEHERAWLVGLCVKLTGHAEAAEDLAQETLIEAWRNLAKFYAHGEEFGTANCRRWLAAIARNVCKRWMRRYYRESEHLVHEEQGADDVALEELATDEDEIEIELEHRDLARFLERAMALLPEAKRSLLIEFYTYRTSHRELAERLGLSVQTVEQRLHRSKQALRRIITTQLCEEATAFGLCKPECSLQQQETRIWCPLCGRGQLTRYYDPEEQRIGFTCPQCWQIASVEQPELWDGLRSSKSILGRQLAYLGTYYWSAIESGQGPCLRCGQLTQARVYRLPDLPVEYEDLLRNIPAELRSHPQDRPAEYLSYISQSGVYIFCPHCQYRELNGLPHLTLDTPEACQFWRKHPRMHLLPLREIEHAGQPAFVSSFQSLSANAQLDIIYQQSTLKILAVKGA
ncbi:sigma-70 family RNA polymerase sigma factor [Ktedonosporobacter rubrisoli]|uniref:Sigma-70 family RNA polymerase sigma factor n=1 Tax=Ktedonosporobacter rubrisoli TaxID=2509675 RepID=A0A4P6JIR1_KTERU|nr:sigma-70 family RNA polymerase sigma factor [Ktedonosporobacter rubrisoli]QBD74977.1 sigma-70 family RNA polymerase sigma factor [Ktedonosporobacter rubrisoli]